MDVRHSGLTRRVAITVTWAGALLILMLSTPRAEATPIVVLTSGTLLSDRTTPFTNINVELVGPDFLLWSFYLYTSFGFPPGGEQYAPGTEVEFDGNVTVGGDTDQPRDGGMLRYRGDWYIAVGDIVLDTGPVPVVKTAETPDGGLLVTVPFTLVGTIYACIPTVVDYPPNGCRLADDRVELSIVGSGMVRAIFLEVPDSNLVQIENIWYDVQQPIPEPTTLLLMAAGVATLGAGARRRRARRA